MVAWGEVRGTQGLPMLRCWAETRSRAPETGSAGNAPCNPPGLHLRGLCTSLLLGGILPARISADAWCAASTSMVSEGQKAASIAHG